MRRILARSMTGVAVSVAAALACERSSPTGPDISVSGAVPRLQVTGPSTVAPGSTAQFTALALVGGIERDVTSTASWTTSDRRLVTIVPGGRATGVAVGDAMIVASVEGTPASKPIVVVPAGTYRLLGSVREAGGSSAVAGARVEARTDDRTLVETTTDVSGNFRLYGVPSGAELRVTRGGYVTHSETVTLTDHASLNVTLTLSAARPDVSGLYTLTVGPATCSNTSILLDPELRRRTYRASIAQDGPQLRVTLGGADFRLIRGVAANQFIGTFDPSRATFQLAPPGYYYLYSSQFAKPDVVEQLADAGGLLIAGTATATVSQGGMTGTLNGVIESYRGLLATTAPTGRCASSSIPFALTR